MNPFMKSPPHEFRIFAKGWNDTYKGKFLFDDEAAREVMAAYAEHGVDRPIDLEHLSIDTESKAYDPDARGWFKLAVRNGELWAVDVKWTPDGAERLMQAKQRYISPFFAFGEKTRRVQSLYNVAICAIPATKDMPALVAASARTKQPIAALSIEAAKMDGLKKILSALGLPEDGTLEDALGAIKAYQEEEGSEGETMKYLRKALGLGDDAKHEDVMSKLKAKLKDDGEEKPKDKKEEEAKDEPKDEEEEMASLSPALKGKFAALKSNAVEMDRRLRELETKQTVSEVDRIVSENTDKIPLHLELWAKEQSPMVLRAFLKHAISQPRSTEKKQDAVVAASIEPTREELTVAKLSGMSREKLVEHKKKLAEEEKERRELRGERN